jgi:hypothetical protein
MIEFAWINGFPTMSTVIAIITFSYHKGEKLDYGNLKVPSLSN